MISPGLLPGSEIGWQAAAGGPRPLQIADDYFKYVVFKNPAWDFRTLDFDRGAALADQIGGGILNAIDPDLRKFERRGGKLLLFHGWSDELISPVNTIEYYESVVKMMGTGKSNGFIRLFMVPGMGHGRGDGPAPNILERWLPPWKSGWRRVPRRRASSHRTRPAERSIGLGRSVHIRKRPCITDLKARMMPQTSRAKPAESK